jgi:hypothetical protein
VLGCSLLGGCGDSGKSLTGSICSVYDCGFNEVAVRQVGATTIQIDYTDGPVTETTTRAAVVVCDISTFTKGVAVPATSVRHIAPDGVGFPTLKEGQCTFNDDLVDGQTVCGSFHATFTTEAGTERALMGEFCSPLVVVPW